MTPSDPQLVLHICQRDHPAEGGAYRVAQALVAEQCKLGMDSRLLFLYGLKGHSPDAGITCHYLGAERGQVGIRTILGLAEFIKRTKPSIIHCHDGLLWPRIALWGWRRIAIHHCHLNATYCGRVKNIINTFMTVHANSRFIAISEQVRNSWLCAGVRSHQIDLILNGVDCSRFIPVDADVARTFKQQLFPNIPDGNRLILWVGRVEQAMKGTDRLKRLIPVLPPGVSLAIVGDGPERLSFLGEFARQIKNGTLLLPGAVEDPLPWYQASDLFLFTSHYEPFGLVLLEAASCNLPIIAFPVMRGGAIYLLDQLMANKLSSDDMEGAAASIKGIFDRSVIDCDKKIINIRKKYAWSTRNILIEQSYKCVLDAL